MKQLTRDYITYINSNKWKQLRKKVIARDQSCVLCGSTRILQVHHRTYRRFGKERLTDLVTLCKRCHMRYERGKSWRRFWNSLADITLKWLGK